MRRRPVDHVADEMARLYHDKGVRYFHFVDENHLPRDPEQAQAVLVELREALARRRVGNRAVSLMLRADVATPQVVESLVRLGVVRCLLGVESNTPEGLAALGRGATPEANELAVRNLTRHNISFHLNVLLVHPESTLASIEAEVQALRDIEGGLLDPFQVEALEGTDLFERLRRRGQLLGGPHVWHFWPEEPAARRFAEAFYLLKRQVMGQQQLTAYAYEVLGTLAVGGKLGRLGSAHRSLAQEGRRHIAIHNALWISLLEEAIAHAKEPRPGQVDALLKTGSLRAASVTLAFCNQPGTDLEPKTNFQLSTVPAFRWYPGIGTVGNRLTQRFWLFTNDLDWNPAVGLGAGWFHHGTSHGPVGELRIWVGDVMFGSVTRGRSVGFFAAASAERAINDDRFRLEIAAGIEAPIYVGN
jgi:hypothetical protein